MRAAIVVLLVRLVAFPATMTVFAADLAGGTVVLGPDGWSRGAGEDARRDGLLVVDLSDEWAPFLLSESDGPGKPVRPNGYRETFVALANDHVTPDEVLLESSSGRAAVLASLPEESRSAEPGVLSPAEDRALERARREVSARRAPNFLEVYGIPPTFSVLGRRVEEDLSKGCHAAVDLEALRALDAEVTFQSRDRARAAYEEAIVDADWVRDELFTRVSAEGVPPEPVTPELLVSDPEVAPRVERYRRGQQRLAAVRAAQSRLVCEGLLAKGTFEPAVFDLATHTALAAFEKENDIFGWGFLDAETREALTRPPLELHFETFRRILAERLADAAGIVEDGSATQAPGGATYTDSSGEVREVPNLIGDFVDALLDALAITTPEDMVAFLRAGVPESVAFAAPALPPYYARAMELSAEIDRGDVWYDFPYDEAGNPRTQPRRRFPHLTVFVTWNGQKIPLIRWRTTIGSWRSEAAADGRIYLKYKNSDVGPRLWKSIVAAPAWLPPDSTPARDLLTRKVFDRRVGPVTMVDTGVIGPGFASAYGLVMAIHLEKRADGTFFDNQIRTHGSVDYTSIARRFSHGCHRLVNDRAVRLFDFILRHRPYRRLGERKLANYRRRFEDRGQRYQYELASRGYYYDLVNPIPVEVLEGRIVGRVKRPIERAVPKPGAGYGVTAAAEPIAPLPVRAP